MEILQANTLLTGSSGTTYRTLERLGHGGMGEAWKAYCDDTDRIVTLKILAASPEPKNRFDLLSTAFVQELAIQAGLRHPGIAPVLDQGIYTGRPFGVMEFRCGTTLQKILERDGISNIRSILETVLVILRYAHKKGIVHRDVKPANILVDDHGVVTLLDWGVARDRNVDEIKIPDIFPGTRRYASPEQKMSLSSIDGRADLFSLGVILRETLIDPAHGGAHASKPMQTGLARLIDQLTAYNRDDRPQDAEAALELVRAIPESFWKPIMSTRAVTYETAREVP